MQSLCNPTYKSVSYLATIIDTREPQSPRITKENAEQRGFLPATFLLVELIASMRSAADHGRIFLLWSFCFFAAVIWVGVEASRATSTAVKRLPDGTTGSW